MESIFGNAARYFPSFSEGLSLRPQRPLSLPRDRPHFPSFSEGLSLRRVRTRHRRRRCARGFPFLFGGAFIEACAWMTRPALSGRDFPSFSEGLSLRHVEQKRKSSQDSQFPFLFGGAFIEALVIAVEVVLGELFPFLFGGAFIEAAKLYCDGRDYHLISLPFRRGFH